MWSSDPALSKTCSKKFVPEIEDLHSTDPEGGRERERETHISK